MGILDDIQSAASSVISAATDKAVSDLNGQSQPNPVTITTPATTASPTASFNSSATTMIFGSLVIGALIFVFKKVKA